MITPKAARRYPCVQSSSVVPLQKNVRLYSKYFENTNNSYKSIRKRQTTQQESWTNKQRETSRTNKGNHPIKH